jgi:hypothetical protein
MVPHLLGVISHCSYLALDVAVLRATALSHGAMSVLVASLAASDPNVIICALHAVARLARHRSSQPLSFSLAN